MKVNTLISLCVKTGMWGMTIKPGEGAKQALLTWKLSMLMCIVLGLNCIFKHFPKFLITKKMIFPRRFGINKIFFI